MGLAFFLLITLPKCTLASEFLISDSEKNLAETPRRHSHKEGAGRGFHSICHSVRHMMNYMTEACVIHHFI